MSKTLYAYTPPPGRALRGGGLPRCTASATRRALRRPVDGLFLVSRNSPGASRFGFLGATRSSAVCPVSVVPSPLGRGRRERRPSRSATRGADGALSLCSLMMPARRNEKQGHPPPFRHPGRRSRSGTQPHKPQGRRRVPDEAPGAVVSSSKVVRLGSGSPLRCGRNDGSGRDARRPDALGSAVASRAGQEPALGLVPRAERSVSRHGACLDAPEHDGTSAFRKRPKAKERPIVLKKASALVGRGQWLHRWIWRE